LAGASDVGGEATWTPSRVLLWGVGF